MSTNASQARGLAALARAHFGDLSAAETKLLELAPKGELAVCGPNDDWGDPQNDPAKAAPWPANRVIRAALIGWLCVHHAARDQVDPKGIQAFGAKIVGKLDLSYAVVPFRLSLRRCRLVEDAEFYSAELPELDFEGTWVRSLKADRISVKGSVFLRNGFRAQGEVRLVGAQIGGDLECYNSAFINPSKDALSADRVTVKGGVFLRRGFRADGELRLLGAQIGGDLVCDNCVLRNPSGAALVADLIGVKGTVFLNDGFRAEGEVGLVGAQIGFDLECDRSAISGKLNAQGAVIKGALVWTKIPNPSQVQLDLRDATVGSFNDDRESWPSHGQLFVDGFVYGRFLGRRRSAKERLEWLNLLKSFTPQPYRQLAKVLKDEGDDAGAKEVLVEMARRDSESSMGWAGQSVRLPWRAIGYGYYPLQALWGLGILTGLGWLLYRRAYLAGAITPVEKKAYEEFKKPGRLPPPHYRRFSPFIYSLENSLPLVTFGQGDSWQPQPNIPAPHRNWAFRLGQFLGSLRHAGEWKARFLLYISSPVFLRRFLWAQILLGWILATLFAAGVTGLVR